MRALVTHRFGEAPVPADVPVPSCPPDGAVIRVQATGLCRSDWHAVMGHDPDVVLPHVPGHEFAGVVAEAGPLVRGHRPGDRVTAPFVNACGTCRQCQAGRQQVCDRQTQPGFTHWGSFAEYVVVDHADVNLVPLPDGVSAAAAAGLGCRFATAFRAVVEVGRLRAGEWAAVHGCGGVGLSAVAIARACGARVVAVDVAPGALTAAAALGADAVVQAAGTADDVAAAVRRAAADHGAAEGIALSLDAYGSPDAAHASIACLAIAGRHVQVGLLPAALGLPPVPLHLVVARELEVLGSHGMAARSYAGLLGLVAAGRLDPGALVQRQIPLDDAGPLLMAMGAGTAPPGVTIAVPPGQDALGGSSTGG